MGSSAEMRVNGQDFIAEKAENHPDWPYLEGPSGGVPMRFRALLPLTCLPLALAAPMAAPAHGSGDRLNDLAFVNRLTWGETAQGDTLNGRSRAAWLEDQLHPGNDDGLPPQIQAAIAGMEI